MEVERSINLEKLDNIMRLDLPIRDASFIGDVNGFYLNSERNYLHNSGWEYKNGFWNPKGKLEL